MAQDPANAPVSVGQAPDVAEGDPKGEGISWIDRSCDRVLESKMGVIKCGRDGHGTHIYSCQVQKYIQSTIGTPCFVLFYYSSP